MNPWIMVCVECELIIIQNRANIVRFGPVDSQTCSQFIRLESNRQDSTSAAYLSNETDGNKAPSVFIVIDLLFLWHPQICNSWKQEVVHADVSSDLPGQHQQHGQPEEDTIDAGGTSHDEVPIHEAAEERGQTDKESQDQRNPNQ